MARLSQRLNDFQARCAPARWRDAPGLLILAVHAVRSGKEESAGLAIDPQLSIGLAEIKEAVVAFLEAGYRFTDLRQIAEGLDPAGRYCLLTADDGYRNQLALLPLLGEFGISAIFFVVPQNIETGESFWWDAVYRKGRQTGKSAGEIRRLAAEIKKIAPARIRPHLISLGLGPADFQPEGDDDRPLSALELRELAAVAQVTIGNHTFGHEILPRCGIEEQRTTIRLAQSYLQEKCGYAPSIIAYPNGDSSASTRQVAAELGLTWGVTVEERREKLPLKPANHGCFRLGRYILSSGEVAAQCRRFRLRHPVTPASLGLKW